MQDNSKIIFDYLVEKARTVGVVSVRNAADQFLKLGLKAATEVTIRRPIPRGWVVRAFTKQNGKCKRCGSDMTMTDVTGDHVIALSQGGRHHQSNIVAMHRSCNSSKNDNDLSTESKRSGNLMNTMFNDNEVVND